MTLEALVKSLLIHHQHVKDHDRRQAQNHRPDADRPNYVLGRKTLLFREWIFLGIHDACPVLSLQGIDTR